MAATHASGVLVTAGTTCAIGASLATVTSSTLDNSTGYGAIITAKVTNATAPTTGCTATLNVSPDGTTWYQWASMTAGVIASTSYPMQFRVEPDTIKAQITFGGVAGTAVTVEAQYEQTTGI